MSDISLFMTHFWLFRRLPNSRPPFFNFIFSHSVYTSPAYISSSSSLRYTVSSSPYLHSYTHSYGPPPQTVRRDFIVPVSKERRELVGNVILYFSVLASAFRLKAPLPPYLPPAEKSRQELVRCHHGSGCHAAHMISLRSTLFASSTSSRRAESRARGSSSTLLMRS